MSNWWNEYADFLRSEYWKNKAEHFKAIRGWQCEECGATEYLHVHHLHYLKPWGHEDEDDIQVLCSECHADKHGRVLWHTKKKVVTFKPTVDLKEHEHVPDGRRVAKKEFLRDGFKTATMLARPMELDPLFEELYAKHNVGFISHALNSMSLKKRRSLNKRVLLMSVTASLTPRAHGVSNALKKKIRQLAGTVSKLSDACESIERTVDMANYWVRPDFSGTLLLYRRERKLADVIAHWPILRYNALGK